MTCGVLLCCGFWTIILLVPFLVTVTGRTEMLLLLLAMEPLSRLPPPFVLGARRVEEEAEEEDAPLVAVTGDALTIELESPLVELPLLFSEMSYEVEPPPSAGSTA